MGFHGKEQNKTIVLFDRVIVGVKFVDAFDLSKVLINLHNFAKLA